MASDVTVSFGADAGELVDALKSIDDDLKQIVASMGGVAQASAQASAALSQMADNGARSGERLRQSTNGLAKATKDWQQAFHPIDRAFSESVSGVIRGTQTMRQAIARFGQSMVASFIDDAEKSTTHWLASELAKTTATKINADARARADSDSTDTGLIKLVDLTLKAIGVDAAKTFADVFAFFAPSMGPAAAGPAAAAQATVAGIASRVNVAHLATGAWDVPRDMLAFIHRGETVMPADFASGFRAAAGGLAGSGGPGANIAIHALDGASVKRVLTENHGAVANALRRAWRHGGGARR